ncbi:hypothetical protein [Virgibacillus proomii]|uniref:hypothetical protein n=1 Tax=Virgibacillus proomii TaxID=84407 RepID=UPI001C122B0B|nr:hypothetical protein [Virgibacillus proomii]MBU5267375.1 hypothetical protein [Virgibacillus proomii]
MRTEETYNRIQEIKKLRRKKYGVISRTSTKNINLLKYVPMQCGYCGRVLSVQQTGKSDKPLFYARHGRAKEMQTGKVYRIHVNAKCYEYNLIKALKDILVSEELSKKYIDFETNDDDLSRLNKSVKSKSKSLKNISQSMDRLLDLYLINEIQKEPYIKKKNELESKIKIINSQIRKIKRKIAAIQKHEWNYESLYQYIEIAKLNWNRLNKT